MLFISQQLSGTKSMFTDNMYIYSLTTYDTSNLIIFALFSFTGESTIDFCFMLLKKNHKKDHKGY